MQSEMVSLPPVARPGDLEVHAPLLCHLRLRDQKSRIPGQVVCTCPDTGVTRVRLQRGVY